MTTIAKIGSKEYPDMAKAAAEIASGETLYVMQNVFGSAGSTAFSKPGNFTVLGVKKDDGSLVKINLAGEKAAWGKAIFNFEEGSYEIGYLHLDNAAVPDSNGACIRLNAKTGKVLIHHCRFTNSENGLLSGIGPADIYVEDCVFEGNGKYTNSREKGRTHNIYGGNSTRMTLTRVTSVESQYGHDLKSRTFKLTLRESEFKGSNEGRALDYPDGGVLDVENCLFYKTADAVQNNLVDIGAEGLSNGVPKDGRPEKYEMRNCHFHNDVNTERDVQFINHRSKVELVLIDPLFTGTAASKDIKSTVRGNVRIVYTGGPKGPLKPVGGNPEGGTPPAPSPSPTPDPVPTPTPTPTPSPNPSTGEVWVKIGVEGQKLTVAAGSRVRYGTAGVGYVEKDVSGEFTASNSFFGKDPAPKTAKVVELKKAEATPAPTPTPVPSTGYLIREKVVYVLVGKDGVEMARFDDKTTAQLILSKF